MRSPALVWLVVSLGAMSTSPARAAAQQIRSAPATSVEQQLLHDEDGWAAALVRRDGAYFDRMLAPGFVYTEDATIYTRDEVIRSATSGADTVTAAHNEGMVVHQPADMIAMVTGLLVVQGRSHGARFTHRYRFTDTWVKNSAGRWQIVAAQDYLLPK